MKSFVLTEHSEPPKVVFSLRMKQFRAQERGKEERVLVFASSKTTQIEKNPNTTEASICHHLKYGVHTRSMILRISLTIKKEEEDWLTKKPSGFAAWY